MKPWTLLMLGLLCAMAIGCPPRPRPRSDFRLRLESLGQRDRRLLCDIWPRHHNPDN